MLGNQFGWIFCLVSGHLVAADQDRTDDQDVSDIASDDAIPFSARDAPGTPRRTASAQASPGRARNTQSSPRSDQHAAVNSASPHTKSHDGTKATKEVTVTQVQPKHVQNEQG